MVGKSPPAMYPACSSPALDRRFGMPPGRNSPCPCGSGRKYKRCCGSEEQSRPALRLIPGGAAAGTPDQPGGASPGSRPWEVDLIPVPVSLGDDRDARPGIVLVVADDLVLHQNVLPHPPSEPGAIAEALASALRATAHASGAIPSAIQVRGTLLATALAGCDLPGTGPISPEKTLPGVDRAAKSLLGFLTGKTDRVTRLSGGQTWRSWGLPAPLISELFRAAAAFYRAAPWRALENEDLLRFESGGTAWSLCVMGAAGEEFGLALYEDRRDFERLIRAASPVKGFRAIRGMMLTVSFDRRQDLPAPMRKEILAAGWEVAAPDAYPVLMALNTPGGGVSEALARQVAAGLRAVAGFATRHGSELRRGRAGRYRWTDADSGATVSVALASRPDISQAPDPLTPALPEGPGAAPAAALAEVEPEALGRGYHALVKEFEALLAGSGLTERTTRRHGMNAELLLDFLSGTQGIPLHAMTEFDLRLFLHDWCLRKVSAPKTLLRGIPLSIKRFLGFVALRDQVFFPWAFPILADRAGFEERLETFPGGFFWDEAVRDWQDEVRLDLTARELLPGTGMAGGGEWGETMGIVEYRLRRELGRRWLLWRDEVIGTGVADPEAVRKELIRRQRSWETAPHPAHGGTSPVEVVAGERKATRR
jgi:hypothetical protein